MKKLVSWELWGVRIIRAILPHKQSMSAARQEGSVTRRVKVNPGIRKDPIPDVVGSESTAPAELRLVLAFGIPPTHPH